jgi:uncharacterized DUF497 family protein
MFEWEEARRRENMALYGVDFVRAALMFDHPVLEREDTRRFHWAGRRIFHGGVMEPAGKPAAHCFGMEGRSG